LKIRFDAGPLSHFPKTAHVAVFCFENAKKPVGSFFYGSGVEQSLVVAREDGFSGKAGQTCLVAPADKQFTRYLFVGLGAESAATLDSLRRATAAAVRRVSALPVKALCLRAPNLISAFDVGQAVAEGALLGLYRYTGFRTVTDPAPKLESVRCLGKDAGEIDALNRGLKQGAAFAEAVITARDLINRPPSDATPAYLIKHARQLAGPRVTVKIFNKAQLAKMGMGALLGVNRGSPEPPFFAHLVYKGAGKTKRTIGICGKGITFDSGGLSLKPPTSMETLKYDMSGAASGFAVIQALAKNQPPNVIVHGFTPLTENLPSGPAVKPGDVLRAYNGKTIEVLNTDAEGRLVLADALSYASEQNLDEVFDIATLTGACSIAVGNQIAAVMSTDPKLLGKFQAAAATAGEKIWELPLEKEYEASLKSQVADLKNIGTAGQAGTIVAALFMKNFVKPNLPWIHLDIASTGWTGSQTALSDVGATGVMIRSLLHHVLSYN
jgi:leucyl aminopeptidase